MKRLGMAAIVLLLPASLAAQSPRAIAEAQSVLETLVESYGPSGMEGPVRDAVRQALPAWASPQTDTAGNLWVTAGQGEPTVVFVAHLDEVGFVVRGIEENGLLALEPLGGIFPELWESRPALVHTGSATLPGVFQPHDSSGMTRADLGTDSRAATEALGVRIGNTVTMPKEYVRLAGYRATARSFDDRVGSTAQILALRHLDPRRLKHRVIFLWSVREEIGLEGARAAADSLRFHAARVHAIDTFVSADSPLEPQAFAVAPVGRGPVARALDNSSVTPPAYLDSLVALARRRDIPLQVGTTNGGNDGSVFSAHGVPDVPIGWPLRYSHSPVEVMDLRDLAHLAEVVQAAAEDW